MKEDRSEFDEEVKNYRHEYKNVREYSKKIRKVIAVLDHAVKVSVFKNKSHLYSPLFVEVEQIAQSSSCVDKSVGSFFRQHKDPMTYYTPIHK